MTSLPKPAGRRREKAGPPALSIAGVTDAIRQWILAGDLAPGQRLVEQELCEWLGVRRGFVRSALAVLAHEGLVDHLPNRGSRVRVVELQEALQIAEMRLVVESFCVARASERITDRDIADLGELADRMQELAEEGDAERLADLSNQVFAAYTRIADHAVAAEISERLRARSGRHKYGLSSTPGRARVALPYWLDLIQAICGRDAEEAQAALRRHAHNVRQTIEALAVEEKSQRGRSWAGPAGEASGARSPRRGSKINAAQPPFPRSGWLHIRNHYDGDNAVFGSTPGAKTRREWGESASRFLKAELKKAGMTYEDLATGLREHGLAESKASIASKLSRGGFAATFLLASLAVISLNNKK